MRATRAARAATALRVCGCPASSASSMMMMRNHPRSVLAGFSSSSAGAASPADDKNKKVAAAKIGNINPEGHTKRFYPRGSVSVAEAATLENSVSSSAAMPAGSCAVLLAGRAIKTPKENTLIVPTRALANAIAIEWEAQQERIQPSSMPLMTMAATTLDVVAPKRAKVIDSLLSYLKTDSACVRVTEDAKLSRRQEKLYGPVLEWFSTEFECAAPPVAQGMFAEALSEETQVTMQWRLFGLTDWELTGLETLAAASKSLVVPLALWRKRITLTEALLMATLEEEHQVDEWNFGGPDHDMRFADVRVRMATGAAFLHLSETDVE